MRIKKKKKEKKNILVDTFKTKILAIIFYA